jgi:hypothetical protein
MRRLAAAAFLVVAASVPAMAAEPIVGVWYRGTPAGTPKREELAVIRALGFNGVTWPASQTHGLESLKVMAADVGLHVTVADRPRPISPESLLNPSERFDILVTSQNARALTAMAWRAVAHGARSLAFDSGAPQGAGLENPDRSLKPWVKLAIDMARQLTLNPRLVEALRPGPGVIVVPESRPALDVALLDAGRSWVLVATNISGRPVAASVRLPAGTPYALWLNMLDATTLAMGGEAAGPLWQLELGGPGARVYVIDKVMK